MAEQFGEKTQDATPHRRQKAREQGQVAKSQDLTSAITLIAAVFVLMYLGGSIANFLGEYTERHLSEPPPMEADLSTATSAMADALAGLASAILPVLSVLMLVAVLANLGQVGFLFLPQKVAPNVSHISLFKGFGRLWGRVVTIP